MRMLKTRGISKNRKRGLIAGVLAIVFFLSQTLLLIPVFAEEGVATLEEALDAGCSITVNKPAGDAYNELQNAGVVLDVYRVADAVPLEGYDAYEFSNWAAPFAFAEDMWAAIQEESKSNGVKAVELDGLTQLLAAAALKDVPEYDPDKDNSQNSPSAGTAKLGEMIDLGKGSDARPGMYLLIAHGNRDDYKIIVKDSRGEDVISTVAVSSSKVFQFAPMLVSVPTKGINRIGTGSIYEADTGEVIGAYPIQTGDTVSEENWINAVIEAKVGVTDRLGSLKITKTLNTHELVDFGGRKDPATFVFDVSVVDKDGRKVYGNVISMVFDGAGGPQEKIISGLPIGAKADVTEVYSGSNYKTTQKYTDIEIKGDEIITAADGTETRVINTEIAAFTNDWNNEWNGGGSVTNTYQTAPKTDPDGTESVEWDLSSGKVKQSYALETAVSQ